MCKTCLAEVESEAVTICTVLPMKVKSLDI